MDASPRKMQDVTEKSCVSSTSEFYYPYECDIKWNGGSIDVDIHSILKVYPSYDDKYGK